jgi:hypothetical protein
VIESSTKVGTEILFENDHVRVWDFRLDAGEESVLHTHLHDYLFVYTTASELEVKMLTDNSDPSVVRSSYADGFVQYNVVGSTPSPAMTHRLRNVGAVPHRQILIEFLRPSESQHTQEPQTNDRGTPFTRLPPEED